MSCFMVDPEHIDALILAAYTHREPWSIFSYHYNGDTGVWDPQRIGSALWNGNVDAVLDRYDGELAANMIGMPPAEWGRYPHRVPTPIEALKFANSYAYQASDSNTWEASEAKAIIDEMKANFITQLDGYEEAPWVWNADAFATPRPVS